MEPETVILRHPTNYSVKTAFFHQKYNFLVPFLNRVLRFNVCFHQLLCGYPRHVGSRTSNHSLTTTTIKAGMGNKCRSPQVARLQRRHCGKCFPSNMAFSLVK